MKDGLNWISILKVVVKIYLISIRHKVEIRAQNYLTEMFFTLSINILLYLYYWYMATPRKSTFRS